jgi:hypothetical protein
VYFYYLRRKISIMKKTALIITIVCLASFAMAQTVTTIDDFESYDNSTSMTLVWDQVANGWGTAVLLTSGGAESTAKSLENTDAGWTNGVIAIDIMSPPAAGYYKITFYYKNGQVNIPVNNLTLAVTQGGSFLVSVNLGSAVQATWAFAETSFATKTTDPITLTLSGDLNTGAKAYAIDQIKLVEILSLPVVIDVKPTEAVRLGNTEELAIIPSGGSGTIASVSFDVGNDGSIESTDFSEPFAFTWDTTVAEPANGDVDIKIVATDDGGTTGGGVYTYTVENKYAGRMKLVLNGTFDNWTGNLPTNWAEFQAVPNASYGPGDDRDGVTSKSLEITFAATDYVNRYTLRSNSWKGYYRDLQTTAWGKGLSCRLCYCIREDGESTWENKLSSLHFIQSTIWKYVESPVYDMYTVVNGVDDVAFCTHMYSATCNWDDVVVRGYDCDIAGCEDWNIY